MYTDMAYNKAIAKFESIEADGSIERKFIEEIIIEEPDLTPEQKKEIKSYAKNLKIS